MRDIENREDIALLVDAFYKKVIPDPLIGEFFTNIVDFSWEVHIPVMVNFWESMLLGAGTYGGNPMMKHIALNRRMPMQGEHFERWLALWKETLNEHFEGAVATMAVVKAEHIAQVMLSKMKWS